MIKQDRGTTGGGVSKMDERVKWTTLLALSLSTAMLLSSCNSLPFLSNKVSSKTERHVKGQVVPAGKQLSVWFVKSNGANIRLAAVSRPKSEENELTSAVESLMKGPDGLEVENGIGTEIPKGTILLGIKSEGDSIELNLSRRFASGGGPTSIKTRLDQLAKTVKAIAGDKKIFVNVEGERLTATNADGLEINQPI